MANITITINERDNRVFVHNRIGNVFHFRGLKVGEDWVISERIPFSKLKRMARILQVPLKGKGESEVFSSIFGENVKSISSLYGGE